MPSLIGIVHRIIPGTGVSITPSDGQGDVTISFTGALSDYVLKAGDSMSGNLDMTLNEIVNFKAENIGTLPAAGNKGRIVYLTTDDHIYLDTGA